MNETDDFTSEWTGSLGQRIARARKERDWTLEKLALETGVSKVSVWNWERDRTRPRRAKLLKLAAAFGIPAEVFLDAKNGRQEMALGVPELIAECQSRIADAVGVVPEAIEITISIGGGVA